jgi:hypothetical protein
MEEMPVPRYPSRSSGSKPLPPAVALSVCIARALHERDPKLLPVLRSNVVSFAGSNHYATGETLREFLEALDDPEIFVRGS